MTDRRVRRRRKEARPAEIIEAGMELLASHGFEGTKLAEVARRAGIAKGTIYLYFESKEALFEAALRERMTRAMEGALQNLPEPEDTTEAQLASFLETVYRGLLAGDALVLFQVLLREGHRFPKLLQLYKDVVIEGGLSLLTHVLRRGAERGELRIDPEKFDPRLIIAPALVSALWVTLFPDEEPLGTEEFAASHLDMVLRGILASR